MSRNRDLVSFKLYAPLPGHPWYRLQYGHAWIPGRFADDRAAYLAVGALDANFGWTSAILQELVAEGGTITAVRLQTRLEEAGSDLALCEEEWKEAGHT
jgi:hypothetical protein